MTIRKSELCGHRVPDIPLRLSCESEVAVIGFYVVLGLHGTVIVVNQLYESHAPTHRPVVSRTTHASVVPYGAWPSPLPTPRDRGLTVSRSP
jgi:hypothetical protein